MTPKDRRDQFLSALKRANRNGPQSRSRLGRRSKGRFRGTGKHDGKAPSDTRVSRSPRGEPTRHRESGFKVDGPGSPAYRMVSRRELSLRDQIERVRDGRERCYAEATPPSGGWRTRRGSHRLPRRFDVRRSVSTCVVHRCEDPGKSRRDMTEDRDGGRVDDNGGSEREGQCCQLVRTVREKETKWKKGEKGEAGRTAMRREDRGITEEAKEERKYRPSSTACGAERRG